MVHSRRGISLMEVMVVIAIMLVLIAVMVPATRSVLQLQQRSAGRKLAVTYERLHDEAVMRNRTFRIVYYLDEDRYVVEAGEAGALIAASPEERDAYMLEVAEKLKYMDEEQKREWYHSKAQPFESLGADGRMEVELPSGVKLGGVYTPQYGRVVRPGEELENAGEDETLKVMSYVMNSGFTEHTLVWLVDAGDPEDGWTIEVEPLSGVVHLHGELLDIHDVRNEIPEEGPTLPN